jgi:hypothetical protein
MPSPPPHGDAAATSQILFLKNYRTNCQSVVSEMDEQFALKIGGLFLIYLQGINFPV